MSILKSLLNPSINLNVTDSTDFLGESWERIGQGLGC